MKETFVEMAKKIIKQESPNINITPTNDFSGSGNTATVAVNSENKTITLKTKSAIKRRDQCCQFKNRLTGKICGSKYFLEIDHIQPKFAQGDNSCENLRLLCKNHNQFRYQIGI